MPPSNMADKSLSEEKALKEKLLDEKMRLIRQRNEERLRRQHEIEEDIKNANTHDKEANNTADFQESRIMSGVAKDKSVPRFRGRARGRALEKMAKETLQANKFKERQKTNFELVEKEVKEEKASTGFLFDDRRVDMSKVGSRSTHSWGGSQFEDVVDKVNSVSTTQTRRTPRKDQNIEINMTGKERLKYQEWKEERQRVDQARQSRQKKGDTWKREWDCNKSQTMSSSFGGRQHHEDRTRSGQRFAKRTAERKPDWNFHDNRGDNDFQQDNTSFPNKENDNGGSIVASSEDWGDVDQPRINTVPNQPSTSSSLPNTTNQSEDWDDAVTSSTGDVPSKKQQENNSKQQWDVSRSKLKNVKPTTGSPQKVFGQSNKNATTIISSGEDWEDNTDTTVTFTTLSHEISIKEGENAQTKISHTVCNNVDKQQNDENNDNMECQTVEMQSTSSDNSEGQRLQNKKCDTVDNSGQAISMTKDDCCKKDPIADKDLTDKNDNETENDAEKYLPKGECHGYNNDSTEVDNNADVIKEKADANDKDETSLSSKQTETAQCDIPSPKGKEMIQDVDHRATNYTKPKENLPKLDLTKADASVEPEPDFLKTPQHKNWADYDFDEEEFDLSQDIFYQA